MAPTEFFIGPKLSRWRARTLLGAFLTLVNPTPLVYAQEGQPDQPGPLEPTVGEAVATERTPPRAADQAPAEEAPVDRVPADQAPETRRLQPVPPEQVAPNNPASAEATGRTMMEAVRAAAARQLTPTAAPEDLRLRTLDTSFPAEQPQLDVPEPPREVIAPPLAPVSPRGPSRRTVARVIDGVTVLTNVTDAPEEDNAVYANVALRRSPETAGLGVPPSRAAMADSPREVSVNANALNPASKTSSSTGLGWWLWVLGGFAALLLVPIGVLLTRPLRKG